MLTVLLILLALFGMAAIDPSRAKFKVGQKVRYVRKGGVTVGGQFRADKIRTGVIRELALAPIDAWDEEGPKHVIGYHVHDAENPAFREFCAKEDIRAVV